MVKGYDDIKSPLPSSALSPAIIAGPCSAESPQQVVDTACTLAQMGVCVFRAGVWKPRTRPGGFEGVGPKALEWLIEAKKQAQIPVATEVATAEHTLLALDAGIDILWIGARTAANPFAVQEIADVLAKVDNPPAILVKNPVSPDLNLWIGAIQRIYDAGVRRIGAIHRGFSAYGETLYRNRPHWSIAYELKRQIPALTMICDPSHIAGRRGLVEETALKASDMAYDALIIETHPNPPCALSDADQQLTPAQLKYLIDRISAQKHSEFVTSDELEALREKIDILDDTLINVLSKRMAVSDEIGKLKHLNRIPVVQPSRYKRLIDDRVAKGRSEGLSEDFLHRLLSIIHDESVKRQITK